MRSAPLAPSPLELGTPTPSPLAGEGWDGGERLLAAFAGLVAAGLFLASPYVFHTTPLARVNALTLLLSLIGLWLFEAPTGRRFTVGAAVLIAALFTKPTAIDAAAACLLFAAVVQRRQAAVSATLVIAGSLVGVALLMSATNGAFLLNVAAANVNPLDLGEGAKNVANFLAVHTVLITLAGVEARRAIRERAWSPWMLFFATSAVLSLGVAKWGAGESYFLPLIAAACVLSGRTIARALARIAWTTNDAQAHAAVGRGLVPRPTSPPPPTSIETQVVAPSDEQAPALRHRYPRRHGEARRRTERQILAFGLGSALLVQCLAFAHGPLSDAAPWLPDRGFQADFLGRAPTAADIDAGDRIARMIREADGPVLSEDVGFAIAAGKDVVGNATHLRNLYESGHWQPTGLVSDVQAKRFGLIILNAELYPAPVLAAVGRFYYIVEQIPLAAATYRIFQPGGDRVESD